MAEVLLADRLRRRGVTACVESAGIAAQVGHPADPLACTLVAERGLDLSAHRARQLTPHLARSFDLILVMDDAQGREVEAMSPGSRGRVHRLGSVGRFDIPDPHRLGRAAFERSLALIERGVDGIEQLLARGRP